MRLVITTALVLFVLVMGVSAVHPVCADNSGGYHFYVYKSSQQMYLCKGQDLDTQMSWPVKISTARNNGPKVASGDQKTPEGDWYLLGAFKTANKAGIWGLTPQSVYGPCVLPINKQATDTGPFQGIFMHGTNEPDKLGSAVSHGCIRNLNDNAQKICNRFWSGNIPKGTPITIYNKNKPALGQQILSKPKPPASQSPVQQGYC